MIHEVEIIRDVGDPRSEQLDRIVLGLNAVIRKVNVLCKVMDRSYATNEHARVLREEVDPNAL